MPRRFIAPLLVGVVIVLLGFTVRLRPRTSAAPKRINVISRTRGNEVLTAEIVNNQVRITLKNNHKDTITAFVIKFTDTLISEDFAYSDVNFGIEPGDSFQKDYAFAVSPLGSDSLYLLTVLLKNGSQDGDSKVAQEIKDERLGEKIQFLRMLRVLEREGQLHKDLKTTKSDIVAALDSGDIDIHAILNELEPTSRSDQKFSDAFTCGLHWGREKVLQRLDILERLSPESREQGFMELKERSHKVFTKL